ncbi:MAG: PhoPQ-activated pathogenicity-related family protein [Bryobacterales bacterium]|nr:PhoPQ-activated pathogenicity-related family protein [Bryobacterales bacterium]
MRTLLILTLALLPAFGAETALDRYVKTPDPNYKYQVVSKLPGKGFTAYVVDMTSQAWLTEKDVNRTIWKHWLTIVVPDKLEHDTGFLMITGGNNRNPAPPTRADGITSAIAVATNSVTAELRMVPNQPLSFHGESKQRVEDEIIAYGWAQFLKGGSEEWLARLPMTKSAVRAMDTITAVMKEQGKTVDKFVVGGASKRGWTTWTTGAVDKRVVAIVPIVIDLLNMVPSFEHHWQVYGAWSPAINDYLENDIMKWSGTKRYRELLKITEPYEYRDRLTMPKYIVNAAGDEFFVLDSWQFYWKDLKGEKNLRYVPNAKHNLAGSDAAETIGAFFSMIVNNKPRPKFDWKLNKDGSITVTTAEKPSAVKLWKATNPDKRDFRLDVIGKAFQAEDLTETKPGVYVARVPKPEKGWTAFFVELAYPSGSKYPIKVTSGTRVVPDVYPYQKPKLGSASGPGPTSTPQAVATGK